MSVAQASKPCPGGPRQAPPRSGRPWATHPLLSLPVLAAFGLFSLPARAMPAASLQLFRLNERGVTALPAISAALQSAGPSSLTPPAIDPASTTAAARNPETGVSGSDQGLALAPSAQPAAVGAADAVQIAQAGGGLSDPKVLDLQPNGSVEINARGESLSASLDPNSLTIRFSRPIPTDLKGPISVRPIQSDGTLGEIQQQISNYTVSADGMQITLKPGRTIPAGSNFAFQFPTTCGQGSCIYPGQPIGQPLYIGFNPSRLIAPVAAAGGFPAWVILVGVAVIGVGVAAASGGFGGGGGDNPSSQ